MTHEQQVEFTSLARARREVAGVVTEQALMPDGRTLERRSHPESGMVSKWKDTRAPFTK